MTYLNNRFAEVLAPSLAHRRAWPGWLVFSVVTVSASLLLWWLNVGLGSQVRIGVLLLVVTLAGSVIARLPRVAYPDTVTFGIVSFLFGLALLGFFGFVVAHRALFALTIFAAPTSRSWVAFAPVLILGALGAYRAGREVSLKRLRIEPRSTALLLAIALCLTAATLYEFYNNGELAPRHNIDRDWHVFQFPKSILETGLPQEIFQHRGLEITLLTAGGLLSDDVLWNGIQVYKFLTVLFYFVLGYATYAFGRYGLPVGQRPALLAGALAGVYSAVYPLPWAMADLTRSSYLGFYSPAGSFYHNANQLVSHAMSIMGLLLMALAWREQRRSFTLGALLLGYASFFKPAFIFYAGPALFLILPFFRKRLSVDLIVGYVCLVAVPAAWVIYPRLMGSAEMPTGLDWQPFAYSQAWLLRNWDIPALANPWISAAVVTISSFALPLGVSAVLMVRLGRSRQKWHTATAQLMAQPTVVFLIVFFLVSVVGGVGFVGPGRVVAGNFTWGTASAYLCILPLLLQVVSTTTPYWASWALRVVLSLHVLAGLRHLIRYIAREAI